MPVSIWQKSQRRVHCGAADQERGLAVFPALEDVRAAGLLADRVQALGFTSVFSSAYSGPMLALALIQSGLRSIGVGGVAGLDAQQPASFGASVTAGSFVGGGQGRVVAAGPAGAGLDQGGSTAEFRLHPVGDVGRSNVRPGLGLDGGGAGIGDAAGNDLAVGGQIILQFKGEAVHGDPVVDPDADGGDLAGGAALVGVDPHTGPALDPGAPYAVIGEHVDQDLLQDVARSRPPWWDRAGRRIG